MKNVMTSRFMKTVLLCIAASFVLIGCSTSELKQELTPMYDATEIGASYKDFAAIVSENHPDFYINDASFDTTTTFDNDTGESTVTISNDMFAPLADGEIDSQRAADLTTIATFGDNRNSKGEKVLVVAHGSDVGSCTYAVHFVDDGDGSHHIIQKDDIDCQTYD